MTKNNKKNDNKKTECPPKKGKEPIVIEEKEEDILATELKGDPENFKQEVKKEAQKGKAMRVLMPIVFFVLLGSIVGSATWYYQRAGQQKDIKNVEEKIQTPPVISDEEVDKKIDSTKEEEDSTQDTKETPPSSPVDYTEYTVKSGDTLSGIANDNNLTSSELAKFNNISNPESLQIGQVLKIPKK